MSAAVNHFKAKVGSLSRQRAADDPELVSARRNLKTAALEEYVQRTVNSWPALTEEQLDRIAGLLQPGSAL